MATTTQPLLPTFSERSTGCYNNWGYMWTGKFDLNTDIRVNVEIFKSGKKKLRIKKYPDRYSGRGLNLLLQ